MEFSRNQRKLVIQALREAEDKTLRYYCIPPYQWQQLPYDLLTREDRDWQTLPDLVLAEVRWLERVGPPGGRRSAYDFFRIQLNDESILRVAAREKMGGNLYPLFVYILTHEMVHLVRLSTILGGEVGPPVSGECEEDRVQRISRQILARSGCPEIAPILQRFCGSDSSIG